MCVCLSPRAARSGFPSCAIKFSQNASEILGFAPSKDPYWAPAPKGPRCYPMLAALSAPLVRGVLPAVSAGFLQRTSALGEWMVRDALRSGGDDADLHHDTGVGLLAWAAGARELNPIPAPEFTATASECFEESVAAPSGHGGGPPRRLVRDRPGMHCVFVHAADPPGLSGGENGGGQAPEAAAAQRLAFEGVRSRVRGEDDDGAAEILPPDTGECPGTASGHGGGGGGGTRRGPYATLREIAAGDSRTAGGVTAAPAGAPEVVRGYLEDCLGLDRPSAAGGGRA